MDTPLPGLGHCDEIISQSRVLAFQFSWTCFGGLPIRVVRDSAKAIIAEEYHHASSIWESGPRNGGERGNRLGDG
jgi:hypothetical protein